MKFKDYYKILGLENNKVDLEEIKVAFREQAKKFHPDVNTGSFSEERFKDINEAYRILSDSRSRRKYDRIWYSYVGKRIERQKDAQGREAKINFMGMLFGTSYNKKEENAHSNKKVPSKGENIEAQIDMQIEEAYFGTNKKISLRTVEGRMKTFEVKIPSGIRNGEKIRLIGEGKKGTNGAKNGDLFIKVKINNDEKYRLKGYDIHTDLVLTPWQAALGTRKQLETLDATSNVYIPKGIGSGETIRISGKGYKDGKGGRGDLVLNVKIVVPKELSNDEVKLYEQLRDISNIEPKIVV